MKKLLFSLGLLLLLTACATNWRASDRNIEFGNELFKKYYTLYGNAFYLSTSSSKSAGYEYVWSLHKDQIIFSTINLNGKVKTENHSGGISWLNKAECDFEYPDCNALLEGDIINIAYFCNGSEYLLEEVFDEYCFRQSKDFFVKNVWNDMRRLKLFL